MRKIEPKIPLPHLNKEVNDSKWNLSWRCDLIGPLLMSIEKSQVIFKTLIDFEFEYWA